MMRLECYFHDFLYLETEIRFFFFLFVYLNTKNIEATDHCAKDTLSPDPDACGGFRIRFHDPFFL